MAPIHKETEEDATASAGAVEGQPGVGLGVPTRDFVVRSLAPSDRAGFLQMWSQYNAFYETVISDAVTRSTWERLIEARVMYGLIAEDAATGASLGFANYVIHASTWSDRQACYLEDLFVRPTARGRGIGGALIQRLAELSESHGFDRLYWMTREGNTVARRLYDRLGKRDDFIRYEMIFADG